MKNRSLGIFFVLALSTMILTCIRPVPAPLPVILNSPVGETVATGDITFSWQTQQPAVSYILQVASDSNFRKIVIEETVNTTSANLHFKTDGRYWWRVRACNESNIWGFWSEAASFILQRFRVVGALKTQGYPHDLAVLGNRLFIADGQAGLAIYDISIPEQPRLQGRYLDSLNVAWGVKVRDSLVFLAYGYKELVIVNAVRPESLKITGVLEYPQPGYGYALALRDSWVYVAAGAQFIAVDISQPEYPNLRFQYYYPRNCRSIAIESANAYVACEQLGIAVWKLDTFPPRQTETFDTDGNARGVDCRDGFITVADGRNGVIFLQQEQTGHLTEFATLQLNGYASAVTIEDTLVFVACGSGGVAVVNCADRANPFLMATIASPYAYKVGAIPGTDYFFVLDRDLGIVTVKKEF